MGKTIFTRSVFVPEDIELAKRKVLSWIQQFSTFCFLDNNRYQSTSHTAECLVGAGVRKYYRVNHSGNALHELEKATRETGRWLFGHLGYDLKAETLGIPSTHADHVGFPDLFFFEPEVVIVLEKNQLSIVAEDPDKIYAEINTISLQHSKDLISYNTVQQRFSEGEYLDTINKLKAHIQRGDCYEVNFCQEFFIEDARIDPLQVYDALTSISPNPFSALYRIEDNWLICASPERYLKKTGSQIISQPIKGTAPRSTSHQIDEELKNQLQQSAKDRSENVMVVDLVRNDLSRVCEEGSVKVEELFGIYTFPQVHQMISTVSGVLKKEVSFPDIVKATFPMGSMTGAPKKKVIELIERYERTKRGIFSGAVGYITPENDFDFNVVIRSILYNQASKYLSFQAGSAITFYSDAKQEWEECFIKAAAIRKVLHDAREKRKSL